MRLSDVYYEVEVNVSPEKAWDVLTRYGDIGDFHPSLKSSRSVDGSPVGLEMGSARQCVIPNGRKDVTLWEKVIDLKEGEKFTYDVYEWKNFPLQRMHFTFGVRERQNKTLLYQQMAYRLRPGFLSGLMKGKLRSGARDGLIGFKHFMETGEIKPDMERLKKKYREF